MCKFPGPVLAAIAGSLALAMPAGAADYDPPMIIEDAPQYVPVEVGSGWYLRGDLSYNVNTSVYDDPFGLDVENNRFGGGIGIGYHFNDLLRADVNLSYVSRDKFDYDDGINAADLENRVLGAMVNGYLDLGTVVGFTPYIGAGVGMLYSKHEASVDWTSSGIDASFSDRQYEFAYSLNAGVSYRFADNLSVDVGYQYLSAPGMEYLDFEAGTVEDGLDYHQIRVGLRYDLW
ncbi:outer membrane protein [Nitratireductor sp. GCM10026969]|uniref:outer membrane protein n=1 Tax=Nitratireductor sp. GCM10026969 TaxID=3252645 RepID=UPI00360C3ECD